MAPNIFHLNFNVTGPERKRLVEAISAYTQAESRYLGAPTFAYEVDYFNIDKNGCVSFDDRADSEEIEGLIDHLVSLGFNGAVIDDSDEEAAEGAQDAPAAEPEEPSQEAGEAATLADSAEDGQEEGLTISLPMDNFGPDALYRLMTLVSNKERLIIKALDAACLTIRTDGDKLVFPWWDHMPEPEETQAYASFIAALCRMAKASSRVNARATEFESEKYAFRCFLLRLGFIGDESKAQRKILMHRLSGTAAFPNKDKADAFSAAQKAKRETVKAAASAKDENSEEVTA